MSKKRKLWFAIEIAAVLLIFITAGTIFYNSSIRNPKGEAARLSSFLIEQDSLRDRLLKDMTLTPSGSIDQDFITAIKLHQNASVQMCENYLTYGSSRRFKKQVRKIIKEKNLELEQIDQLRKQCLDSTTDPESYEIYLDHYNNMLALSSHSTHGISTDLTIEELFAQYMIRHEKMALDMSDSIFSLTQNTSIKEMAQKIADTENKEMEIMAAIQ